MRKKPLPKSLSDVPAAPGPLSDAISEISLGKHSPEFIIIIASTYIELMVNAAVEASCKHAADMKHDHRSWPHGNKLTLLHELHIISDHHYRLLKWLKNLRNDIAHKWGFKITAKHLDIFAEPEHQKISNLSHVCVFILIEFWATHSELVGPKVAGYLKYEPPVKLPMVRVPSPKYVMPLVNEPKSILVPRYGIDNIVDKITEK